MDIKYEGLTPQMPKIKKNQTATVIHCEPGKIVLNVERSSSCSGCSERNACAHRSTEHFLNKSITLTLNDAKTYEVGQSVEIELDTKIILKSAFLLYVVPLLTLLITAVLIEQFTHNQVMIFGGALLIFLFSLFVIRHKIHSYEKYVVNQIKIDGGRDLNSDSKSSPNLDSSCDRN